MSAHKRTAGAVALAVSAAVILIGCGGGGDPTSTATTTPSSTTGTAGVQCATSISEFNASPSVNATSTSNWTCYSTARILSANGLPDHATGAFPNIDNANTISARTVTASFTLTPVATSTAKQLDGPAGVIGFVLNGVKIDAGTNGGCNDAGSACDPGMPAGQWRIEALGQSSFRFGTDDNNAHVQPDGEYHYHGVPEGFVTKQNKGVAMTLIGWAADGFPIYARYGYSDASNATSPIKPVTASWRLKTTPDASRPPVNLYAMGTFTQDYEYVAGLGDLDECNGRTGVTPEFPGGIYHYYATDAYPFLQRCVKGQL